MLVRADHDLRVEAGFASKTGKRPDNQDYVAICFGPRGPGALQGVVAAVADGVGGHKGGREAAETAVRGFIEGYYAQPETLGALRAGTRALEAVNGWIAAQSRADPQLEGMATTFSALMLSRRAGFVLHVGDSRVYRLDSSGLEQLTKDHNVGRGDFPNALRRAIGFEDALPFDHASIGLKPHDRFLLSSDGVHGVLREVELRALLAERRSPQETADAIVTAALEAGGSDNSTALVLDVVDLPPSDQRSLSDAIAALPIRELPSVGEVVDGFRLDSLIAEGRYSRLFKATDATNGKTLALKFPHPRVAEETSYRLAFVNEAWVAARVRSPFVGEIVELTPGRQTRLYSAMPFYDGETLEARLRRAPRVELAEGVAIATRLARALAALHRAGIIHRDVKPDNVILSQDGGLRLVDLGVCRAPHLEDFPQQDIPGTPSYMAPELFQGHSGDEASDLFALGVTLYRMFANAYPYGEIEPFSKPRFDKPQPLCAKRPDLPAWLDATVARVTAVDPRQRFGDVLEFAFELENGAATSPQVKPRRKSLYERNPLLFWKSVCLLLTFLLFLALAVR